MACESIRFLRFVSQRQRKTDKKLPHIYMGVPQVRVSHVQLLKTLIPDPLYDELTQNTVIVITDVWQIDVVVLVLVLFCGLVSREHSTL